MQRHSIPILIAGTLLLILSACESGGDETVLQTPDAAVDAFFDAIRKADFDAYKATAPKAIIDYNTIAAKEKVEQGIYDNEQEAWQAHFEYAQRVWRFDRYKRLPVQMIDESHATILLEVEADSDDEGPTAITFELRRTDGVWRIMHHRVEPD